MNKFLHPETAAIHSGKNLISGNMGVNTPVHVDSAFKYQSSQEVMYPRYFNTPNNKVVAQKIAVLEKGEAALLFSSGMAAISTSLLSNLKTGQHAIFSRDLYGGTYNFIVKEFPRMGIEYTFVDASDLGLVEESIKTETRLIYVESPSNPLLNIIDLRGISAMAKDHGLITMIDNTFATPINQLPLELGIDVVLHSGTKYLGGHSDLCFGVSISSNTHIEKIHQHALNFGGSLNAMDLYLIERSLKTLPLRVNQQTKNAQVLAKALLSMDGIKHVFYPGLSCHPSHTIAVKQMNGFGAMLAVELDSKKEETVHAFLSNLKLIETAISLGGVETTVSSPSATSHAKMPEKERLKLGISNSTLRFSIGIEHHEDLLLDLKTALKAAFQFNLV
jgi:cystathionine beta-lyase